MRFIPNEVRLRNRACMQSFRRDISSNSGFRVDGRCLAFAGKRVMRRTKGIVRILSNAARWSNLSLLRGVLIQQEEKSRKICAHMAICSVVRWLSRVHIRDDGGTTGPANPAARP